MTTYPKQPLHHRLAAHDHGRLLATTRFRKAVSLACTWFIISSQVQVRALPSLVDPGLENCSTSATACYVQYKVTSAGLKKCQFQEFIHDDPPRVHIYHERKAREIYNQNYSYSGSLGCYTVNDQNPACIHYTTNYPGPYSGTYSNHFDFTRDEIYSGASCIYSLTYTGGGTLVDNSSDSRTNVAWGSTDCTPCGAYTRTYLGQNCTQTTTLTQMPIDGTTQWVRIDSFSGASTETGGDYCTAWGTSTNPCGTNTTSVFSFDTSGDDVSRTHEETDLNTPVTWPQCNDPDVNYTITDTKTVDLYNEYTDGELWTNIVGQMPGYPEQWYTPNGTGMDIMNWIAYSVIDGNHYKAEYWEPDADAVLQQMRYRFVLPDTKADMDYTISWDVITYDIPSGQVSSDPHSLTLHGAQGPTTEVDSAGFDQPAPNWDNSLDEMGGYVISWVDNVSVTAAPRQNVSSIGSGPNFSTDTGCATCGSSAGGGLRQPEGVTARFGLGRVTGGFSAGNLFLGASQPSLGLATPAALGCSTSDPNVTVIQVSNQIRQVKAPEGFADVITDSPFAYEIRFYLPSQVSSVTNGSGLYYLLGSPSPFVTWTIQNPDASTNVFNRLNITETRGGAANTYTYVYTAAAGKWVIDYPGGLREDQTVTTINTNTSSGFGYTRTVVTTTSLPGGAGQSKLKRVYQNLGGAQAYNNREHLVEETLSPDTAPKTTTYAYDAGIMGQGTFQPLRIVVHPDGSWLYYQYVSDLSAPGSMPYGGQRVSAVYSGIGDTPPPPQNYPYPIISGDYRYTQYDYQPLSGSSDDGTLGPYSPRTITRYMQTASEGRVLVSLEYRVFLPGETRAIRCQRSSAAWSDSDNLVTITKYFTNGPNLNRIKSVQNPDGTMVLYDYSQASDGSQTNTVWSGQPNGSGTSIIDGTTDVTVIGPVGQMVSHTVSDIASGGTVLQKDIFSNYDSFNRPQQVSHLDNTAEITHYDCCGIDYTVDRDSVTNSFGYDAMKRPVTSTRLGITTTTVLDPAGRTLQTIRTGTDNSSIVLSQSQFDLAGRPLSETNALGGVTTYTETNDPTTGGLIRTTSYPNGGTRVEAYYLDGSLKQVSGTAVHGARYQQGLEPPFTSGTPYYLAPYSLEVKLNADGSDSSEWTESFSDFLGRPFAVVSSDATPGDLSDNPASLTFYNGQGQVWKETDPDGVATLRTYNGKGEALYNITALSSTAANLSDYPSLTNSLSGLLANIDRVACTISDVTTDHGTSVRRSRTYVWPTLNSNTSNLVSVAETSTNGLNSWQTTYRDANTPVTSSSQTSYGTGGSRSVTSFAPDNSYTISRYSYGRLTSVTRYDSLGNQLSSISYSYDPHGRQSTVTDARNGKTTYSYNNADLVSSVTTPDPQSPGCSPQTTLTVYNKMLQATNVVNPDGTGVINVYLLTGELGQTSGARTYPVAYTYDYGGRMKTMQTWQNYPSSGSALTTWYYDLHRGFLTNKVYNDGKGPLYSYTPAGRLKTRTWARGVTTTYTFDPAGSLSTVAYSDSTPGVSYTSDRLGRPTSITQNGITTTLAYNLAGEPLSESYSGGTLGGLSVTNGFDTFMRRTNLTALNGSTVLLQDAFTFDNASRLQTASAGTASAFYSYLTNSSLVGQVLYTNGGVQRMTTTKQFDFLNRLQSISSAPSASSAVSFSYSYNNANQRTAVQLGDSSYWRFGYDSLGQVTSGHKYFADQTPVAGQQFDYGFDTIGNRTQTKAGGDALGPNQWVANYSANLLNQYTSRDVPGAVDVMGNSIATNTVTVNGQTAYRKGEYFRQQLNVNNTNSAVWTNITVSATGQSSQSGNQFVPKTQEQFACDLDGNLTRDGRWNYGWDAENRLVALTNNNASVGPQQVIRFEYDGKGRRIRKQVWGNNVGSGSPTNDVKFLYDGWNVVAILNSPSSLLESFLWGLDLSGAPQGAGGVGGLLALAYYGASTTNCFVAFDGNGNVAALVNATNGTSAAQYEFGPFGELIRATGPMAKAHPFRFSTKYQDDETDLLYYGYRYYSASAGRWLGRDPIEERGGTSLYVYVGNLPACSIDPLGRATRSGGTQALKPTDVTFHDTKIGSVQAWKNTAVSPAELNDAIWIELDKAPNCPKCRWTQWIRRNEYDNQNPPNQRTGPYSTASGALLQVFDKWFLDAAGGDWAYWPAESTSEVEAIYDQPSVGSGLSERWVKDVADFESFLLCQIALPCTSETKWEPAFRVSWTLTQQWPKKNRDYDVLKGLSITSFTDLPNGLSQAINAGQWIYGYGNPENGTLGPPRFVTNPTK